MAIVSTVSGGRTHMAAGTAYLGSVNSYQNWLTKLIAKIFRLAFSVSINGKERLVNKKSYHKFLSSVGYGGAVDLRDHQEFTRIPSKTDSLPPGNMRDFLSARKRVKLFKKLAQAILDRNQERAVKMIHKGADLERIYHQMGNRALSFIDDFSQELNPDRAYSFQVMRAAPLIHAQKRQLDTVVHSLIEAGADKQTRGEAYRWKRRIAGINRQTSWELFPALGILPGLVLGVGIGRRETAEPLYQIKRKNKEDVSFQEQS